ncbi:MAG TPA: ethanolamine ammonia-lyase subunit EutC [Acidobacteriaceae bacterium]|jgi:ethanolamine ammonia-lyase small subunit
MTHEILKPPPTSARIALGLTGTSIPTREHLRFQLDHALARDAVNAELDVPLLMRGLAQRDLECLSLHSAVHHASGKHERQSYLLRPDLGRRLSPASRELLEQHAAHATPDVVFVLADGLSAVAVERHALPLLEATLHLLGSEAWTLAPVCVVTHGRVAIGDDIGQILGARLAVVLLGERPGLSSADSLGAYLTWNPVPGRTDADRNCISNIRAEGLSYAAAAKRLAFYLSEARRRGLTGTALKQDLPAESLTGNGNLTGSA